MFALRVTTSRDAAGVPTPQGYERVTKGALTIDTGLGGLYGFRFELENGVAIGESLAPVNQARIESLITSGERLVNGQRLLGNDILALAYLDGATNSAYLVGSVSSTRPYYFNLRNGAFCCSTSIKALAELGVPVEADEETYPEFLVYRFVTPPKTLYKGISKLIGGQSLAMDLGVGKVTQDKVYRFDHNVSAGQDEPAIRDHLGGILSNQIELALKSSERPGVLLSGGLDSSLLASLAVRSNQQIASTSSSFAFVDENDAESDYALSVADHLGIKHSVYEGSAKEYLTGMVESIWHAEEPVHHLQSVMLYLLFKHQAGQDLLICGEGADGLFGNDMHAKLNKYGGLLTTARRAGLLHLYRQWVRMFGVSGYRWRFFANEFGPDLHRSNHLLWTLGQFGNAEAVKQQFGCADEAIIATHRSLMQNYQDESLLKQVSIQSLLCEGFVTMCVWGKLAESQNLALHYPFTTTPMIDYITSVPWELKLKEPKYFVRALLRAQSFPEAFITRPKMSFGFPYRHWALPDTMFQPVVDMAADMWDRKWLQSLQTTEAGRAMILWGVLSLYLWRRMFIDKQTPEALVGEILEQSERQEKNG